MRKFLSISVIALPVVIPIWASKDRTARRGLRRTVWGVLAFFVAWAVIGSRLYLASPGSE